MKKTSVAIIGLGYVGLPLATAFASKYPTFGYDINTIRIKELISGIDRNNQLSKVELSNLEKITFTDSINDIKNCTYYIITVPTPINEHLEPDISLLLSAAEAVGSILKKGDWIIIESTVYPGLTEEELIPIIEATSNLVVNKDFIVGYSPERINPGDKVHTIYNTTKIVSCSDNNYIDKIEALYRDALGCPVHKTSSIKIAEASKIIENVQRDINIAFVNELSILFDRLSIDIYEVLSAADTKWNFHLYKPGLVGGHCIGVDPYYLAHKSKSVGLIPEILLAGRRINDNMSEYHASQIVKMLSKNRIEITKSNVVIFGFSFKENCPDIRNTKVYNLYKHLLEYGITVHIIDPVVNPQEVKEIYSIDVSKTIDDAINYDMVILAVAHQDFLKIDFQHFKLCYDIKGIIKNKIGDNQAKNFK